MDFLDRGVAGDVDGVERLLQACLGLVDADFAEALDNLGAGIVVADGGNLCNSRNAKQRELVEALALGGGNVDGACVKDFYEVPFLGFLRSGW